MAEHRPLTGMQTVRLGGTFLVAVCLGTAASVLLLDHTVNFFRPTQELSTRSLRPASGIVVNTRRFHLAALRSAGGGDGAKEVAVDMPPHLKPGALAASLLLGVTSVPALAVMAAVVLIVRSQYLHVVPNPLTAEQWELLNVFPGRLKPVEIAAPAVPANPLTFEVVNATQPATASTPGGPPSTAGAATARNAGSGGTPSTDEMEPPAGPPERFGMYAPSPSVGAPAAGAVRAAAGVAALEGLLVAGAARRALTRLPVLLGLADLLDRLDDAKQRNRQQNKHTQGSFTPVEREHFSLPMQVVEGAIPAGLEGLYVRVGPNPTKHMLSRGYHLFDGHGMIHSIRLANGTAVYSNQYVRTPRLELEQQLQRPVLPQVGEFHGVVGLLKAAVLWPLITQASGLTPEEQGTANTNVYLHDHRLYVGHENSYPMEIQWRKDNSFDTLGYNTMGGQLDYPVTAHPKVDLDDGRLYFNGYKVVHEVDMKYGVYSEGKLQTYLPFKLGQRCFLHDMLITQHYVVFFESSIAVDITGIVNGKLMAYNEGHRMRIGLFPKRANDSVAVRWFEAPGSLGMVHAMNAWEAGPDEVAVFAAGVRACDSEFKESVPSHLHHFRLNLGTGAMTLEVVSPDHMVEFPRVHPKFQGRPSQFGYAGQFVTDSDWLMGVLKFDLFSRRVVGAIPLPEGTMCGEPVPIPKPGPAGQRSDGVYLGFFVHRKGQSGGEWRLYDGETMSPQPVVCLTVDEYVPIGFHGEWIAQPDLLAHLARAQVA